MSRHLPVLTAAFVIAFTGPHQAAAQTSAASIGGAPLTRIGVVVRDVHEAAGDKLEETVRLFQSNGAAWINGKLGGSYMYLDFTESLGSFFELNGNWGTAVTQPEQTLIHETGRQ